MRSTAACLGTLLLLLPAHAWGDWPTVRGNPQRTGYTEVPVRPPFQILWVRHFARERISSAVEPIVMNRRVFIGTHQGNLYALHAETGQPLWRYRTQGAFLHSPACADERVIAGSTDGVLHAVDARTGKAQWHLRTDSGGFAASPTLHNGRAYIGTRRGTLLAVDIRTGKIAWSTRLPAPSRQTAAVAGERLYLVAEDLRARAFDTATGRTLWTSDPLSGQSSRDYYPVIARANNRTFVVVRTAPYHQISQRLHRDAHELCRIAGISPGWEAIEAWLRSPSARGDAMRWKQEQEALTKYLEAHRDARTCYVLDAETGRPASQPPILYAAGCQGVPAPPVVLPDGRLFTLYRSAYGNWTLGVAPMVALGFLDPATGAITPLAHRHGETPPWNTFWGTADESQNAVIAGQTALLVHQSTISGFDWQTGTLFPIAGDRDSWGGFRNLLWARNEWNGPARGGVAVADGRLYWQTGSRVLCIQSDREGTSARDTAIDAASLPAEQVPQGDFKVERVRKELAETVEEWLSQPWMPLCMEPGLAGREFAFDHSGEIFEALAWAYPHLPGPLQQKVKAALSKLWAEHPPYTAATRLPLRQGAPREWSPAPADLREPADAPLPHPFGNLYAVWLYAERCGEWARVREAWPQMQQSVQEFQQTGWSLNGQKGDLYANRYLSAWIAVEKMAQRMQDMGMAQQARQERERLQNALLTWWKRAAREVKLTVIPSIKEWDEFLSRADALFLNIRTHRTRPALLQDLNPEIAAFLKREGLEDVRKVLEVFEALCPTWHLVGEERQVHTGENLYDPPVFALSAFRAAAWLQDLPVEALAYRADIPFCKADLYHMQKLAISLEKGTMRQ
ncbi:MAG: PQQ-binding-like beta-propeller repeat protein [Chloroherpetonaceae bacterium]|nr:PQQ-binding-like beta-propeller repeat protein [Chthonomonadaceae bacterium]MDW8206279.1 PQQ-binding-like beta-propeller repeat protein [Chloroherpetonaceae bacterium]